MSPGGAFRIDQYWLLPVLIILKYLLCINYSEWLFEVKSLSEPWDFRSGYEWIREKKIYNNLFESSKTPITIFKNLDITSDFFKDFTKNIYVKIILLIFVAFIFAKIVDLFSGKDCCPQVPVNK